MEEQEVLQGAKEEKALTKEMKEAIDYLIVEKGKLTNLQTEYKEAVGAVAEKLGVKPAVLNRRIDLIIKEEEKGGEVKSKENDLDFVEKYFTLKTNLEK